MDGLRSKRIAVCGVLLALALTLPLPAEAGEEGVRSVPADIRAEALKPSVGAAGRPLPLSGHWHANNRPLDLQIRMIRAGRHMFPFIEFPSVGQLEGERLEQYRQRMAGPLKQIREWGLPLVLCGTQFEQVLYDRKMKWRWLPPEENPLVWPTAPPADKVNPEALRKHGIPEALVRRAEAEGVPALAKVSPFGPIGPWREAGRWWTDNPAFAVLQELYPDPPLIIFLSNNEGKKLDIDEAEQSVRFHKLFGKDYRAEDVQAAFAEGYLARFRALQDGMREGLANDTWRKHARIVAYNSFGPISLGRYPTQYTVEHGFVGTRMWDGGMPEYYDNFWEPEKSDHTLFSMQISAMNWPFMLDSVYRRNPEYWFELIFWDGGQPARGKPNLYIRRGQVWDPARYRGYCQFGLWLTRPRVSREFRGSTQENDAIVRPYWEALLEMVELVHDNELLGDFWRHGQLVPNPAHAHPYQWQLPEALKDEQRWFLLDCDTHPDLYDGTYKDYYSLHRSPMQGKWDRFRRTYEHIPVYALALVRGRKPEREWLVYAHATLAAQADVGITIPEYGQIRADAISRSGTFLLVAERDRSVTVVHRGGPAEVAVTTADQTPETGEPIELSAVVTCPSAASIDTFRWTFDDGREIEEKELSAHRIAWSEVGTHMVRVRGMHGGREVVLGERPVYVGLQSPDNLICHLPLDGAFSKERAYALNQEGLIPWRRLPDASGPGRAVALVGDATFVEDPERGRVLHLAGKTGMVLLPRTKEMNLSTITRRTISFWCRPEGDSKRQILLDLGARGWWLKPYREAGFSIYLDGTVLYAGAYVGEWGTWLKHEGVQAGQWTQVSLVLDAPDEEVKPNRMHLYVNGQNVASGPARAIPPHATGHMMAPEAILGGYGNTRCHDGPPANGNDAKGKALYFFQGCLADFRMANTASPPVR